jgi:multiple sugar transport system permease protein
MKGIVKRGLTDHQIILWFILPTIFLILFIVIYPLIWSIYLSFYDYNALLKEPPRFLGFGNYAEILRDPHMWTYFQITGKFVFLSVLSQFLIGFGVALLLNRKFKGEGVVSTLMLTPMMLCPVIVGIFWRFLYDPTFGVQNYYMKTLLEIPPIGWLSDPKYAMIAMVIVDTWMWSPFMMLISLAGLSAIPKYLYEAAEIDRASGWSKFIHITLPLVSPLLLVALLMRTMDAFKLFDLVFGLTGGGPADMTSTLSFEIYKTSFLKFYTGRSCAMAFILAIIIIALSNVFIRLLNRLKA